VKNNQENQIQNITLCNIPKYTVYNGVCGKAPRSWGVFENVCVKSNLEVYKVTITVSYKNGQQDVLHAPPPKKKMKITHFAVFKKHLM